jgi:hypothetical protein
MYCQNLSSDYENDVWEAGSEEVPDYVNLHELATLDAE